MPLPTFQKALSACADRPEEAAEIALLAVEELERRDPDPRSFTHVAMAAHAAQPVTGPLAGTVFSAKDNIDVGGMPTTCGSRLFEEHVAAQDAAVVARLRTAGAVCIGKNNMGELALEPTGANPRFGTTLNPYDETRSAGGSSGGSALAVALSEVHFALGTDSGGSVRLPAAMCGVVGFKPTGGALSLEGVRGSPWTIDQIGLLTPTTEELTTAWRVLSPEDGTPSRTTNTRIAYLEDDSLGRVAPEVWSAYLDAIERLRRSGVDLVGISLPGFSTAPHVCVSIAYAEIAAQHHELLRRSPSLYTDNIRELLYLGELWPSTNYVQAQQLRRSMESEFRLRTADVDAVVMPTLPIQPPRFGEPAHVPGDDPAAALFTWIRFTVLFNVIGYPAVSLPAGLDTDGLPVGLQVVGKPFADRRLLDIAVNLEQALGSVPPPPSRIKTLPSNHRQDENPS